MKRCALVIVLTLVQNSCLVLRAAPGWIDDVGNLIHYLCYEKQYLEALEQKKKQDNQLCAQVRNGLFLYFKKRGDGAIFEDFAKKLCVQMQQDPHYQDTSSRDLFIQQVNQYLPIYLLRLMIDEAEIEIRHRLQKFQQSPPIDPKLVKPLNTDKVVQEIKEVITHELLNSGRDWQRFTGQDLQRRIQFEVEKRAGIYDVPEAYLRPPPRAASSQPTRSQQQKGKDEIFEIYPALRDLQRNQDFHRRREESGNKMHRADECSTCLEEFAQKQNKVRVTLFCGHSICPQCLYKILYGGFGTNQACPQCRGHIMTEDFPQEKLRQYCTDSASA